MGRVAEHHGADVTATGTLDEATSNIKVSTSNKAAT